MRMVLVGMREYPKPAPARSPFQAQRQGRNDSPRDPLDRLARFEQLIEIVTEQFDRDVGADACNQLVHAHLDRLGELVIIAGDFIHRLVQLGDELIAGFARVGPRSEEHTSELQSLMRISYAVLCLKKKKKLIQE